MNTDKIYAQKIAEEYTDSKERKVNALKRLDRAVKRPGKIFSFTFGIVFCLIFGTGFSLILKAISFNPDIDFLIGLIFSFFGILGMAINYPIYLSVLKHQKEKYSSDILKLADEIIKENKSE